MEQSIKSRETRLKLSAYSTGITARWCAQENIYARPQANCWRARNDWSATSSSGHYLMFASHETNLPLAANYSPTYRDTNLCYIVRRLFLICRSQGKTARNLSEFSPARQTRISTRWWAIGCLLTAKRANCNANSNREMKFKKRWKEQRGGRGSVRVDVSVERVNSPCERLARFSRVRYGSLMFLDKAFRSSRFVGEKPRGKQTARRQRKRSGSFRSRLFITRKEHRKTGALRGFCQAAASSRIKVASGAVPVPRNSQKLCAFAANNLAFMATDAPIWSFRRSAATTTRCTIQDRGWRPWTPLLAWPCHSEVATKRSEREKRDGETARILFAIKARDNLKAITITHGLRVYAVRWLTALAWSPLRSRTHIRASMVFCWLAPPLLRDRDRFAWPSAFRVNPPCSFSWLCDFHAGSSYLRVCKTENKFSPLAESRMEIVVDDRYVDPTNASKYQKFYAAEIMAV